MRIAFKAMITKISFMLIAVKHLNHGAFACLYSHTSMMFYKSTTRLPDFFCLALFGSLI